MIGGVLSIGDELILGQTLDTNSQWLSALLLQHGVMVREHRTVGDDRRAIAEAVRELAGSCDVVILTGGLGPTDDDLTREALSDVCTPGEELVEDAGALRDVEQWFSGRARSMPPSNRRQARRPRTMRCLSNANGTAPGLAGEVGTALVFSFPGPPVELRPMMLHYAVDAIEQRRRGERIVTAAVHIYGLGESAAAERLGDMMQRERVPLVGTTASNGIITARIRATGLGEGIEEAVSHDVKRIEELWKPYVFGHGDATLASSVGTLLTERKLTVATAESCTGGWLGKLLVDVPGSSRYYLGGWVTYSNAMKERELGVSSTILTKYGAVSRETGSAMALGALQQSGADMAAAITGVAGPDGGTVSRPVGCVFVGVAEQRDGGIREYIRQFRLAGDRATIRLRSAQAALQMIRFAILGIDDRQPLLWEVREATA